MRDPHPNSKRSCETQLIATIQGISKNLKSGKDQVDVILFRLLKPLMRYPFKGFCLNPTSTAYMTTPFNGFHHFYMDEHNRSLLRDAHQRNWMFYQEFHREQSLVPSFFLSALMTYPLSANHQRLTCLPTTHSCTGTLPRTGILPNYKKI